MTEIAVLEFNPFAENTYVVYDETGECALFDPGCYTFEEQQRLLRFIESKKLKPTRLINTHCHLDHVFGNYYAAKQWNLNLEIHEGELPVLERFEHTCLSYGVPGAQASPLPSRYIVDGEWIEFGNTRLQAMLTPGHSPASLSFYCPDEGFVIAGDVLFFESIGRTDFEGGNHETLLHSIRTRLFTLPGETLVYPGHGPSTSIRHEMEYNPFL